MLAALPAAAALLLLAACAGPQSVLDPAGREASEIARLFWVMLAGAVVLWVAVNALFLFVTRIKPQSMSRWLAEAVIVGGGIALPLVVLSVLLVWGLGLMADQRQPGDGLRLRITGEQFWWRVEYLPEGATEPVISANEIRLPAGQRVDLELTSDTVIHSFWVPALGGKMDMFPGRTTTLTLEAETPGTYRGQCAEFCGLSHALMAFNAVVMPEADFAAWLEQEAAPASAAEGPGAALFAAEGCGGCHAVRGTEWVANVGPDLSHVGRRTSLAAGILPMTEEALVSWIRAPEAHKPGVEMPAYDHMDEADLATVARWLMELK
ncbi:cytochrome c oxidase subunit II [Roseivivax sp. CAU 1761]